MKNAKYLTFIPLILWIVLYTVLVAILVYFTNLKFLYALMFIPIFCMFDLIWWILVMNDKKALDRFTIFSFLIVLNFPAYFFAKKFREYLISEEIKKTGNAKNLIQPHLDLEYDLLPEWEKELIEQKNAKKMAKTEQKSAQYLTDNLFSLQRLIIDSYNQFLLYKVMKFNPGLTQTFELNQIIKQQVNDDEFKKKSILKFANVYLEWIDAEIIKKYSHLENINDYIVKVLNETSPEEILVSYKQNRINNTIIVKRKISENKKQ